MCTLYTMNLRAAFFAVHVTLFSAGFTSAQLDQVDLPIDYESSTIDYTVTDFGGNASELVTDPENPDNSCIKSVKSPCAASWAGTTISTPSGLASFIPVTNEFATVTARVWAPSAGIPILFKIENANNATWVCETLSYTTTSGWQWMQFDLTNEAPGTQSLAVGLSLGWTYNMASMFFNFGTDGTGQIFYFDDIYFGELIGCMDEAACNYNPHATSAGVACEYPEAGVDCNGDCTDPDLCPIPGCMDNQAANYDAQANVADDSCLYDMDYINNLTPQSSCPGDFNNDNTVSVADLLAFLILFGATC